MNPEDFELRELDFLIRRVTERIRFAEVANVKKPEDEAFRLQVLRKLMARRDELLKVHPREAVKAEFARRDRGGFRPMRDGIDYDSSEQ